MSNTHRWFGVLMIGLALGCGSDDNGDSNAGTGGTGVAATGGTVAPTGGTGAAATGGTTVAGTTGGTTTTGGTVDNCGGAVCTVPANLQAVAPPCCDPNTNTCGMMGQFLCVPVYNDPGGHSCPSENIQGMEIPGCCADGTACGVVDTLAGTGCATRELAGIVLGLLDPTIMLSPINCDGSIPPPATDGGVTP